MTDPRDATSSALPVVTQGLTIRHRDRVVVDSVDLTVSPGRITALVGPNGAGKSSLLQGCLGLIPIHSGTVHLFGAGFGKGRRAVAYIPQRAAVDLDFPINALQVVCHGMTGELGWLRRFGRKHRARALQALERVGVEHMAHQQFGTLSGGEQQRVFLARALVQDARLLVMDEALSGVDLATERVIFQLLRDLCEEGRSVWMVHHDLHTVATACDDAILFQGRVMAQGCAAEVLQDDVLERTFGAPLVVSADRHDPACGHPDHQSDPPSRPAAGVRAPQQH